MAHSRRGEAHQHGVRRARSASNPTSSVCKPIPPEPCLPQDKLPKRSEMESPKEKREQPIRTSGNIPCKEPIPAECQSRDCRRMRTAHPQRWLRCPRPYLAGRPPPPCPLRRPAERLDRSGIRSRGGGRAASGPCRPCPLSRRSTESVRDDGYWQIGTCVVVRENRAHQPKAVYSEHRGDEPVT